MAVDEFGREVLTSHHPPQPHSPRPRSRSHGSAPHNSERNSISPSPSYRRRRRGRDRDRSYSRDEREESRSRKRKHASEKYAGEAMLCRYVWEQQLKAQKKNENANTNATDDAENNEDEKEDNAEFSSPFETEEQALAAYTQYNTKYCLTYIRTFFNTHLDHPFFRLLLSPLTQYSAAQSEILRSQIESNEFRKEILHSLEERSLGVIPKKDPDCNDYLSMPRCGFVGGCRLGVGVKPVSKRPHHHHGHNHHHHPHSHSHNHHGGPNHHHGGPTEEEFILSEQDRNRIERHAKSHLHSFVKSESVLKILSVPPQVTNEMISQALGRYCDKKEMTSWSSSVHIPTLTESEELPYHREVYVTFSSKEVKDTCLDKLHRGRRRNDRLPRTLDLEVDCTDVYGRKNVDLDGYGGGPPKNKKEEGMLPQKTIRVKISTANIVKSQPVAVLSAAVSSRARISRDRASVTQIAERLDDIRNISPENRLAAQLRLLYPTQDEWDAVDDEDVLDVSIAYLRRVHLFSFYNGCVMADCVGNVLSSHAGTIFLRLRNADEILKKMSEDRGEEGSIEETVAKDMLIMRLDESVNKALEWVKERGEWVVDEETDGKAKEIQASEKEAREVWLENHGTIDEDGRARCSFHWCKKLFKDKAFLQKHLLKKHSDHLRSECAKCHDQSMMSAWDNIENRPVPPVLIDCGAKFRKVPSAVVGAAEPMAHDPEPELWKEEEERMAEEERLRRQEEEERIAEEERIRAEEQRRIEAAAAGEKRKGNFVDVDDMVEEKVELKMEDVVVAPPAKKKKKKKSLL